jgi:hypothetical protein
MEAGGKWIIIGLFPNGISTPQIPFPLPMLTFFQALRADCPGVYKFKGKLSELTTGNALAHAQGQLQTVQAGPIIFPAALPNLQFKAFGVYTWSLEIEGQEEPFLTEFSVTHLPPQIRYGPPPKF